MWKRGQRTDVLSTVSSRCCVPLLDAMTFPYLRPSPSVHSVESQSPVFPNVPESLLVALSASAATIGRGVTRRVGHVTLWQGAGGTNAPRLEAALQAPAVRSQSPPKTVDHGLLLPRKLGRQPGLLASSLSDTQPGSADGPFSATRRSNERGRSAFCECRTGRADGRSSSLCWAVQYGGCIAALVCARWTRSA